MSFSRVVKWLVIGWAASVIICGILNFAHPSTSVSDVRALSVVAIEAGLILVFREIPHGD